MASIKGIEMRSVKNFEGHEGAGFSANIFMDGKKIGTVLDSAYGGCFDYYYISKEVKEIVEKRIKDYYTAFPPEDSGSLYHMKETEFDPDNVPRKKYKDIFEVEDHFFSDLYDLSQYEKEFKKAQKKNGFTVVLEYYILGDLKYLSPEIYTCFSDQHEKQVLDIGLKKSKTAHISVFRSLDDFKIYI